MIRFSPPRFVAPRFAPPRFRPSRFGGAAAGLAPILRLLPADVGGGAFNGTSDFYSVPVEFDLTEKTIALVATVTGTASSTVAAFALHGSGAVNYIELQSGATGAFRGRIRAANVGQASSFIDPATPANVIANAIGQKALFLVRVRADGFAVIVGDQAVQTMARSGGTDTITTLVVGRGRSTGYCAMQLHELQILPSTADVDVQRMANSLAAAHGLTAPIITPFLDTVAVGFGDSNMVGVGSTAGLNAFAEVALARCLAVIERTSPVTAIAGAQVSPFGETDPTKLAVAFPTVTAVPSNFSSRSLVVVGYGTNDFGQDVPIGSASDMTPNTVWGAAKIGFANLIAQGLPTIVCLPFPRQGETVANGAGHVLQDYRAAIAEAALNVDATVCDFSDLWAADADAATFTVDGLHPNDAGHLLGGLRLAQVIRAGASVPA